MKAKLYSAICRRTHTAILINVSGKVLTLYHLPIDLLFLSAFKINVKGNSNSRDKMILISKSILKEGR